jgi:hypothetical protein
MRVVGFDPAMAKRDGYAIRRNAEGKEYAVKLNAKGQGIASTVVPEASVCGDGYIDYDPMGNRKTIVYTAASATPRFRSWLTPPSTRSRLASQHDGPLGTIGWPLSPS